MPGMCFEGGVSCQHRTDTITMSCVLDCSDFAKAVDRLLPRIPQTTSLTAVVASALQCSLQQHLRNTGDTCASCNYHTCYRLQSCHVFAGILCLIFCL
jgi:hypothetical protein